MQIVGDKTLRGHSLSQGSLPAQAGWDSSSNASLCEKKIAAYAPPLSETQDYDFVSHSILARNSNLLR